MVIVCLIIDQSVLSFFFVAPKMSMTFSDHFTRTVSGQLLLRTVYSVETSTMFFYLSTKSCW